MEKVIQTIDQIVKKSLFKELTGHDYFHAVRVYNLGLQIARTEDCNPFVVGISGYLHDLFRPYERRTGNLHYGKHALSEIKTILDSLEIHQNIKEAVIDSIRHHEENEHPKNNNLSIETKCLQDADRLDGMGAIGIARVFMFGAAYDRPIYIPKNTRINSSIRYIKEGLLKFSELMHTEEGKKLAKEKRDFMEKYLHRFFEEWEQSIC